MDLGQIFTNESVADYMASLFCLDKDANLLDPCFGEGAFLQAVISNGYTNIEGYEIDSDLYKTTKQKYPELTLYNQDFLCIAPKKKYDGIIMNPPYIRQEKIDDLKPLGITKKILRENLLFSTLPSTANLYMYFILKAIDMLKEQGELVVIFPSNWLQTKTGKQFEHSLYSNCTLTKQIHIVGEIFKKDALVEVVILHLKKGIFNIEAVIKNTKVSNGVFTQQHIISNINEFGFKIPFSKTGSVRRGITTGYNAMYINPPFEDEKSEIHLQPIISTPKSVEGYGVENAKIDRVFLPDLESDLPSEIQTYLIEWKNKIKKSGRPKALFAKIKSNDDYWYRIKSIDTAGILFGYFVRNEMKFIFNQKEYLARDNFYIIKPHIDVLLAFSLLNNFYTFLQLENSGKKYGAGLLKLQRYDIESLKFPDVDLFSSEDIIHLKFLSERLIHTGNTDVVKEITRTISKYATVDYRTVVDQYFMIKKQRLESHTNGK